MKLPAFLDWFGWCTWDAFYTDVTAEGVEEGLERYSCCISWTLMITNGKKLAICVSS